MQSHDEMSKHHPTRRQINRTLVRCKGGAHDDERNDRAKRSQQADDHRKMMKRHFDYNDYMDLDD